MMNKKYKIGESYKDIEPHEVFLDKLAQEKEEDWGITGKRFEVPLSRRSLYSIFAIFFIIGIILFSKIFWFQIIEGGQLHSLADNNKGKIGLVRAERGIIYDKNGTRLVLNSPAYDFVCDKRNISQGNSDSIKEISEVAQVLKIDIAAIEDNIGKSTSSKIVIAENLNQENLLILETKINDLPDCQIEKNTARNYVTGSIFSHVLGYTSRVSQSDLQNYDNYTASDYIGKTGLEKSYEKDLRGTPGTVEYLRTATGSKKSEKILSQPIAGDNLVLNIDANLQKEVYAALEKSIKNVGSKKGAAVAMDPATGAILALVSFPAYDDNIFSQGISQADFAKLINDPSQPFFNRAIAANYPTGSTIKPFEASGALQEKLISPTKLINDPGYILVPNQYDSSIVYKYSGVTPHGLVDMRKAIAVSSNIYFYTIGGGYGDQKGLGPTKIEKYLSLFGWGKPTGVDLPGEFAGFIPTPEWKKKTKKEGWWDGDTYNLAIGQSDLAVTPIQLASAYCYIANGGILYKPQIVQKIVDGSPDAGEVMKSFNPEVIRSNFIDPQNLQVVREGMRDGVRKDYGSSHSLNDIGVPIAAKTGTAEIGRVGFYNTWTASFAPYDNPKIVFIATIEGVQGFRAATLPVAHDVLSWYFLQGQNNK